MAFDTNVAVGPTSLDNTSGDLPARLAISPKVSEMRSEPDVGAPYTEISPAKDAATDTFSKEFTVRQSKLPHVRTQPRSRLVTLQSWEGFVTSINEADNSFTARLFDLETEATGDEEEAVLYLDDVDTDDLELVALGGVFRWIIGYREQPFGKRERISALVFRRLPAWTECDLKDAAVRGQALSDAIRWE
ncbi:MAG TPA: hypothetical protein VGL66_19895 [Caulobacteraceae bacterium]|jgi:hypothetical protein